MQVAVLQRCFRQEQMQFAVLERHFRQEQRQAAVLQRYLGQEQIQAFLNRSRNVGTYIDFKTSERTSTYIDFKTSERRLHFATLNSVDVTSSDGVNSKQDP